MAKKSGGGSNTREKNGQGTSKVPNLEQQTADRRAKKARQKANAGRHNVPSMREPAPGTDYMKNRNRLEWELRRSRERATTNVVVEQTEINRRGLKMLDILDPTMVSPSRVAAEVLRRVMMTYVSEYTMPQQNSENRHSLAKLKALDGLNGQLHSYASRQLDKAERTARH